MSLPPVTQHSPHQKQPKRWYVAPLIVVVAWLGMFIVGRVWDGPISIVNNVTIGGIRALIGGVAEESIIPLRDDPEYVMPRKESARLDILILGLRGEADEENGNFLTDTIMILSIDERTHQSSLVSIPRDMYVRITDTVSDKINSAYLRLGEEATKRLFSRITGVYIDHIVAVDFEAFRSIVDALDGVTITLDRPFEENQQWGYSFSLPEGENTLDGEQALYYARSRFSTSDFDRSRRQQQIILAIKNKVSEIGILKNPITAVKLANTLRKNVSSDLNIFDLTTLTRLGRLAGDTDAMKRYVIHSENLLYESLSTGAYLLLPRQNTFSYLKEFMQELPSTTQVPIIDLEPPAPTPDGDENES